MHRYPETVLVLSSIQRYDKITLNVLKYREKFPNTVEVNLH